MKERDWGFLLLGVCIFGILFDIAIKVKAYIPSEMIPISYVIFLNGWLSTLLVLIILTYSIYLIKKKQK